MCPPGVGAFVPFLLSELAFQESLFTLQNCADIKCDLQDWWKALSEKERPLA